MGFIRSALLFFIGSLLLISLIVGNIFLTFDMSLTYENVESGLATTINGILEGRSEVLETEGMNLTETVEDGLVAMQDYCINNTEYVYSEGDFEIMITCDSVSGGIDEIINESINNIVSEIYYKEYACDFWDCFGQEKLPLFLVSEKSQKYWQNKFYWSLLVSMILIVLVFLFVESKKNFPIVLGILMVASSLPFMKLNLFLTLFDGVLSEFILIFVSKSISVFWIFFLSGIVFIGLGILLRFVDLGVFIARKINEINKKNKDVKSNNKK